MRDFIFRAWDGGEYINHDSLCCPSYSLGEILNGDIDVQQYTGFKDRNGVMIFEGDIVKSTDENDEIEILNSDTGVGCVEWLNEYGFWSVSKIENGLGDLLQYCNIEVVGNIYENPELLSDD